MTHAAWEKCRAFLWWSLIGLSCSTTPLNISAQTPDYNLSRPRSAQEFQFTKVDLALLRQADAFDKYAEDHGWVYRDSRIDEYLQKVGLSLVPAETPAHVVWQFRVIRDLEVNAFASPNGSIYVNSGLFGRIENEAQLAGVLAHEITHVVNRHTYLAQRSMRKKMVAIDLIQGATSVASYGGVNPLIMEAMGNIFPIMVEYTMFGYSRELEHEADVYAVDMLRARGYDLHEFARGFELFGKGPEVQLAAEPAFWASHPKLADRVKYIENAAGQEPPNTSPGTINRAAYVAAAADIIRRNAEMAILLGRPRTAVASALRLTGDEPNNPDNYVLLGDAYRSLGGRTPLPEPEEMTANAKEATRKRLRKMTLVEYDKALMAEAGAPRNWQVNWDRSQKAYQKAIEMDAHVASAHRGLGYLWEANNAMPQAIEQFNLYLDMAPEAKDARQIKLHLEKLSGSAVGAGSSNSKSELNK